MLPDATRKRIYLGAISLALPGLVLGWWLQSDTNVFVAVAYPPLIVHLIAMATLLLRDAPRLIALERVTLVLVAVVALGRFGYILSSFGPERAAAAWEAAQGAPSLLLILLVVFTYIVLPTRSALVAAGAVIAATALLGLATFVPAALAGDVRPLLGFVIFGGYLGLISVFVHLLASLKEALTRTARDAERFAREASSDRLTGLPNRRALERELERRIAESERYDRPLSVLSFDLDYFKRVNDEHGHDVGDALLRAVGRRLLPYLRAGDMLGRWGGEEFLVIAPSTELAAARELALRCATKLAATRFERGIRTTASFGVTVREPGDTTAAMLRRADALLYRAKREGRNRVCAGSSRSLP